MIAKLCRLLMEMSVSQFSSSVVSDTLWLHGLQHARFPCPSPPPGVYSNSCPLSLWCHPTIFEYCNIKIQKSRTNPENRNLGKLCIAHVTDHSPHQPAFISWFKAVLPHFPPVMGRATEVSAALVSSCVYIHHQSLETSSRSPGCESKLLCQWLNWYDISLNFQD